jgi:hypothetical protein
MTSLGIAVAAASLLLGSALSMAANETGGFPDVRDQWKTSVDHLVTGSGPHYRKDANPGQARNEKADVTLTIDRQEGRKFWGQFQREWRGDPGARGDRQRQEDDVPGGRHRRACHRHARRA